MTWQDELQHLDAELAAGRISAEEYRSRRDAALARAQGDPSAPAPGSPPSGVPQQPPQQQPGQNPFPPAFSWGEAAKQGAAQGGSSEESTQVVHNPNLNQPPPDAERTQTVNIGQNQPPAWDQQPGWGAQQPGWGTQDGGTPWGNSDLPPAPEHGDTSWMRQGPEVFESAGKSSKGKLIAGISIAAVLVVGVVVAVVFYFSSPGGDKPEAQTPPPKPSPTKTLPEPPEAKPQPPANPAEVLIAAPSGPKHAFNGSLTPAELEGRKSGLLSAPVRNFALRNGMIGGFFNGTEGPPQATLLAVQMPDQAAAKQLAEQYLEDQEGLSVDKDLSYQGVEVVSTGGGVFRTAYTSHNWAVIVQVNDPSKQTGESLFTSLLQQQLAQSPPTVRK